ncbi:HipA domain-containing protein [Pseudomonas sp. PDM16]|uniref:HipA domain-containing protein n=1 Tax=Pseudomonas sp. PDM16 TaxID=2769292 RepID=UPI00177E7D90|nr:HipA domain-containing protein [Pseudomonas sp. PDM16]MBD9413481.1 HipA domain-containing protein [Pseudomonas sp. PDM16]
MKRELLAWIGNRLVGHLRDDNGIWSFSYADGWADFDLCPNLPAKNRTIVDGSSHRPVQWYFDNLLPEEGQRQLLAGDARLDASDAFALLTHYGAESAGSLTLLPPGQELPEGALRPLPDADLSRRIEAMPRLPLTHEANKRMSLAGAQHKLAVVFDQAELYEPVGALPSTHILKPDHPEQAFAHSVINEWFSMRLAACVGLSVPQASRLYVPQPVYLIKRFDREQRGGNWQRLHSIDACQMLGLDRHFKYQAGSIERLAELSSLTTAPAIARTRLFGWLVFNVLLGNTDAHLKNISFLVTARGEQLAPFYDLLCTAVYETRAFDQDRWPQATTLAWPILGEANLARIARSHLLDAAEALGIKRSPANAQLQRMQERIVAEADALLVEVEQENAQISAGRPELRATFAGEMRCLRAIRALIAEQAQRLAD